MAKKVLLFLSRLNPGSQAAEYDCPDGSKVTGVQSNEAPVKYLLHRYPDIAEVICVVTEDAKATAWDGFCREIHKENAEVKITDISCVGEDSRTFIEGPMTQILTRVNPGDEIYLDTTGGFRNAVTYMLLITRILSYSEIPVKAAVYSNYNKKEIEDLSGTMGLFDLVEGMQELTSFGSINSIRQYYRANGKKDEKIENMLRAVEELTDTITLCRTRKLDEKTEQFNQALKEAEQSEDFLFRQMLTAFKEKFGGQWNVVSVLKWCVESGMIQQALTIYTERIPSYIMTLGLLNLKESADRENMYCKLDKKEYEDGNAVLFLRGFLSLSQDRKELGINGTLKRFRDKLKDASLQEQIIRCTNRNSSMGESLVLAMVGDGELEKGIRNVMSFLRFFYCENAGADEKTISRFKRKFAKLATPEMIQWIEERQGIKCPRTMKNMLNSLGGANQNVLLSFLELYGKTEEKAYKDRNVVTLEHMEELIAESDFVLGCSCGRMKKVAMDYIYVKRLRNMTNHANDESLGDGKELMEYLYEQGYPRLEDTTLRQISEAILGYVETIESEA